METLKFHNKIDIFNKLISSDDIVLDVGFWGQGVTWESLLWPHKLLRSKAKEVWGVDIAYDESIIPESDRYRYTKAPAEDFSFEQKFNIIFAGDLIEHLINPGMFLDTAKRHLAPGGKIILTTPNAFSLYVLASKLTHEEPPINPDHTFYFNRRTIKVLLEKCNFKVQSFGFMYTLGYIHKESLKKKILNLLNRLLRTRTLKFDETLVVVAIPK